MFKPSRQTAEQVVQSLQTPPAHLPGLERVGPLAGAAPPDQPASQPLLASQAYRPDAHSHHAPLPGSPIDPANVQVAMGEELSRFLGTLSLWHGTVQPGTRTRVMGANRRFEPELAANLARRLGLAGPSPQAVAAFERVSDEFYQWVVSKPDESRQQGLEVAATGEIFLNCPPARAVLPPLDR